MSTPNLIKPGQAYALNKLVNTVAESRDARLHIISRLIGRKVLTSFDVMRSEWVKIRNNAYPSWHKDDWTVSEAFIREMHQLNQDFRERVLGQMRLFD